MMLSLAGISPTMGFIAKFYLIVAGVDSSLFRPMTALVIGSVSELYYYLRMLVEMAMPVPAEPTSALPVTPLLFGNAVIAVLLALLLALGAYPAPAIALIRMTVCASS
jgi:NADH-quinone oxidoreductase subunit N